MDVIVYVLDYLKNTSKLANVVTTSSRKVWESLKAEAMTMERLMSSF